MNLSSAIPERVLVTGGAGFIGSHLVDLLLENGRQVTVLDNMSSGNQQWLDGALQHERLRFVRGELTDGALVRTVMASQQQVWHFAGNADIPRGLSDCHIDIDSAVVGTRNVLQAMVAEGVEDLLFASSGAVYGSLARELVSEESGPLYPLSMYAAGKIGAEAIISAHANLFGIRAWIFRFGNVLGARMPRGAIRDFALRLAENPATLTILGDGAQAKSYFLVEDCIAGMAWALSAVPLSGPRTVEILNLGNPGVTSVVTMAQRVVEAMGLSDVTFEYTGGAEAWPGDQPVVRLDVSRVQQLGWSPPRDSDTAVAIGARRMVEHLGLEGPEGR